MVVQTYVVSASRWKSLKNRRLQNWGGVVHEKGLLPQDLPPWLKKLTERICEQTGLFPSAINHVLINEYLPEQGIMPHQDGPAYFPVVAILSLQSPVVIDFTPHPRLKECKDKDKVTAENQDITDSSSKVGENGLSDELIPREEYDRQPQSLLLMPRSLLIFKDQAYSDYLHGIEDSEVHRLDKVANVSEIPKLQDTIVASSSDSAGGIGSSFHRTSNRASLTCRLVPKVHKKLFKF
ncbi:uncharacterized protein A4U43_C07F8400 [Asparagus officinalis]|uniref:Fe2OG dioxygenase domain-containing protein n=1 Tax=Asparagus officinalis TaxID=4686 RepID=A0A5P1EAN6_ASPOF|nr:uncharacterized protein A4U43_C07F8400 [Asparagus officinalis]